MKIGVITGIIGGEEYWSCWGKNFKALSVDTPYGEHANPIYTGDFGDNRVFTLQRHNLQYKHMPSKTPWCANTYAVAQQKPDFVIHVTVCGSLVEKFSAGDLVLFDQVVDFTKHRPSTMGDHIIRPTKNLKKITNLEMYEPISTHLISRASAIFGDTITHYCNATLVCIEGPRFATKGESFVYNKLGCDLISMSSAPEIFLLREMGIPILALGLVTDQDNIAKDTNKRVSMANVANKINDFNMIIPKALEHLFIHFSTSDLL